MPLRTPREVVEAYNYELWNKKNYALGAEIIAETVVRYTPGSRKTMSREEALQRVKDTYANNFSACEFRLPHLLVDGEYVTIVWEMLASTLEGKDFVFSSIEVFRVVDGQICEFWNPVNAPEPNGIWG